MYIFIGMAVCGSIILTLIELKLNGYFDRHREEKDKKVKS